jgi:hypothetical protein
MVAESLAFAAAHAANIECRRAAAANNAKPSFSTSDIPGS